MHVHVAAPQFQAGVLDRRGGRQSGVGDTDVRAAELHRHVFEDARYRGLVLHVGDGPAHKVRTELLGEHLQHRSQGCGVNVAEQNAGAVGGQAPRRGRANATGAAGDHGDSRGFPFPLLPRATRLKGV